MPYMQFASITSNAKISREVELLLVSQRDKNDREMEEERFVCNLMIPSLSMWIKVI